MLSKFKDPQVEAYCTMKENCRRALMLSSLGSTEHISSSELCCDVCSKGKVPYVRVDVMSVLRRKSHRKPKAVHVVDTALKKRLYLCLADERRKVMEENPSYSVLGSSVVCCNTVLHAIGERSSYVSTLEHMFLSST